MVTTGVAKRVNQPNTVRAHTSYLCWYSSTLHHHHTSHMSSFHLESPRLVPNETKLHARTQWCTRLFVALVREHVPGKRAGPFRFHVRALNHGRRSAVSCGVAANRAQCTHARARGSRSFPRRPTVISCRDRGRGCHQRRDRDRAARGGGGAGGRNERAKGKGRGVWANEKHTFQHTFSLKNSLGVRLHTEMVLPPIPSHSNGVASTLKWFSRFDCEF